MAGKNHVDNTVAERRLRPIYDWLDNNNNKKALQEAEKVLKKQPNFLCAKVLKGLALLRLGKEDDCQALLEAVRAEEPSDDSTLQAMSICYRELHQPERVVGMYEAATRREPGNEELMTHLFMAYVRVGDLKRQQQAALALYKLKPKNPYYFWAVMSVVMQARAGGDAQAASISLPLAERMVVKLRNEGRLEAEQEVQLYLVILEMQGKLEDALEVVSGPLSEKLVSLVPLPLKRAQLLVQLQRWQEANVLYKQLLLADINQWAYYLQYMDTAFHLMNESRSSQPDVNQSQPRPSESQANQDTAKRKGEAASTADPAIGDAGIEQPALEADTSCEAMAAFLDALQALNRGLERVARGPTLARLELFRRVEQRGIDPVPLLGDAVDLVMGYAVKFGDRPCCVSDLRPFLPLVPPADRSFLLALLVENADLPTNSSPLPATASQSQHGTNQDGELAVSEDLAQRLETTTLHEMAQGIARTTDAREEPASEAGTQSTDPAGDAPSPARASAERRPWAGGDALALPWELDGGARPETVGQMLRHLSALQLSRCLGAAPQDLPAPDAANDVGALPCPATIESAAHARRLEALHQHGANICPPATTTEFKCNDGYALLAAHAHWDLWTRTRCSGHLLEALAVLGRALNASASNFHCKLLQLKLLHVLGAGSEAHEVYRRLDVKHMQLDSMGHLHCCHLLSTGQLALAARLYDNTLKFFTTNYKDSIEHLTFSYKFGSFAKIEEFRDFRERLNNSAHYACAATEKMLLELSTAASWEAATDLLRAMEVRPEEDSVRWPALTDNRDLQLVVNWDPPHRRVDENGRAASFAAELEFLRLRSLILRCLAASAQLPGKDQLSEGKEASALETLDRLLGELTAHCEKCQRRPIPAHPVESISLPLPCRLERWPWGATLALVALLESTAASARAHGGAATAHGGVDSALALALAVRAVCDQVHAQAALEDPLAARRDLLENIVNVTEALSLAALACAVHRALLTPSMPAHQRRNRKRKEPAVVQELHSEGQQAYERLVSTLSASVEALASALAAWQLTLPNERSACADKAFDALGCAQVRKQVDESHLGSLRELQQHLDSKLKFLAGIQIGR